MAITTPTADFVTGTLQATISAVDDTATIDTGLDLPATNGVLQLGYASTQVVGASNGPETIFYTAYNDATGALTGITRGVAGTTGVIHDSAEGMTVQAGWSTYYLTQEPLKKVIDGAAWTDYTPTWTATSVNPTIGTGNIEGRYTQIGKIVHCHGILKMGATTTFGTGDYRISLPVTAIATCRATGSVHVIDYNTRNYTGVAVITGTDNLYFTTDNMGNPFSSTSPITWVDNDFFTWSITYEAA